MTENLPEEELEKLIEQFQACDAKELHVKFGEVEIYLSRDPGGSIEVSAVPSTEAVPASVPEPGPGPAKTDTPESTEAPASAGLAEGGVQVLAPYMGTFYRSPSPGAAPYVEVGQEVTAETELCLVEVMKLFTAVRAGVSGRIMAVLVEDGSMVEPNQPLFVVEAAD